MSSNALSLNPPWRERNLRRLLGRLCAKYGFEKPNDRRALDLMNAAAKAVMTELPDITIAYGVSDEYSFVFHKTCGLFDRRSSKLVSTIASTFTAYYVHLWSSYFPDTPLSPPLPSFDGRAVCYPTVQNLRDYMSWRQVDCHINNLYNTTFWSLVQLGDMGTKDAEKFLAVCRCFLAAGAIGTNQAIYRALSLQTRTKYYTRSSISTTTTKPISSRRAVWYFEM